MKILLVLTALISTMSKLYGQNDDSLYKLTKISDSYPSSMVSVGESMLFFDYNVDDEHTRGMYKLDPETNTPQFVHSVYESSALDQKKTVLNNVYYFNGVDDDNVAHLYRTDGTPEGTYKLPRGSEENLGISKSQISILNNQIFYDCWSENNDRFFATDGVNTRAIVVDCYSYGGNLATSNGLLYFQAWHQERGMEPYVSNGTTQGTSLLKDINTRRGYIDSNEPYRESHSYAHSFQPFGSATCFVAKTYNGSLSYPDSQQESFDIYLTDGSPSNTFKITNFSSTTHSWDIDILATTDTEIYFAHRSDQTYKALYVYKNGSVTKLLDEPVHIKSPVIYNQKLYFINNADDNNFWVTDGTVANTKSIASIPYACHITEYNNELLIFSDKHYQIEVGISAFNETTQQVRGLPSDVAFWTGDTGYGICGTLEHDGFLYIAAKSGFYKLGPGAMPETLTISNSSIILARNKNFTLTASLLPLNVPYRTVEWTSENSSVASVEKYTGVVAGISEGKTTITATSVLYPEFSVSCEVEVITADKPDILNISFKDEARPCAIHNYKYDDNNVVHVFFDSNTSTSELTLESLTLAPLATCTPNLYDINDFSQPIEVTVTSGNGYKTAKWVIIATNIINTDNLYKSDISLSLTIDSEIGWYPSSWTEKGLLFNIYQYPQSNDKQFSFDSDKLSLYPALLSIKSKVGNDDLKRIELTASSSSYSEETCILGYKNGEMVDSVGIYGNSSSMYYQMGNEQTYDSIHIFSKELYIEDLSIWTQSEPGQNALITFTVTGNGDVLPNATISINSSSLKTNNNGIAEISLPLGNYSYNVSHSDFDTHEGTVDLQNDENISINLQKTTSANLISQNKPLAHPNPFTNNLTLNNVPIGTEVIMVNISGQIIKHFDYSQQPICTQDLTPGVYFIILNLPNGEKQRIKTIKQ